jgi:hypothetical protein
VLRALPAASAILAVLLSAGSAGADAPEVVVVESHDRVLAHWIAAARDGRLPREGVTIVHVDAHPDLSVPAGPRARGWSEDPSGILASVNIASFQLAAVRLGLVDEIVWLRPRWAETFPDGERTFRLGVLPSGRLAVDDPSDHYVLDEGYADPSLLSDAQPVRFRVLPIDAAVAQGGLHAESPVVLDVDLDVFATRNPWAERLRSAGFGDADLDRLRSIFAPSGLALAADPATRVAEVQALIDAVAALGAGEWSSLPGAIPIFWARGIGPFDLWALYRMLGRAGGDATALDLLVRDGRQVIGLPERRADPVEIAETAASIRALLEHGSVRPGLVTIARSVDDGFTPRDAWPLIEWTLLGELGRSLPLGAKIRFDPGLAPAPRPTGGPPPPP